MKKKYILGAALALVAALTACSNTNLPTPNYEAPTVPSVVISDTEIQFTSAIQTSTEGTQNSAEESFTQANFTVLIAPWQSDEIPTAAMTPEEAAEIGEVYIRDVFGESIDGMYVVMHYADCWLRPYRGRWQGIVTATVEPTDDEPSWYVIDGSMGSWGIGEMRFHFSIDSETGERLEISYNAPNNPLVLPPHDTQPLWESAQGLAIQAMSNQELAIFVGISPEQLSAYTQDVIALAEAHFNNTALKNVAMGRNVITPNGPQRLQGIHVLLDTDEDGNIFGIPTGFEFTVTDYAGKEAIVTISEFNQGYRSVRIWSVL